MAKKKSARTFDENGLTSRQSQIVEYIKKCDRAGLTPTIRQIGEKFKIVSLNGVMCHLNALEKKRFISRDKLISRGIKLATRLSGRSVSSEDGKTELDLTQFSGAAGMSVENLAKGVYRITSAVGEIFATITVH